MLSLCEARQSQRADEQPEVPQSDVVEARHVSRLTMMPASHSATT